jgi:hypothetical protein
MYRAPEPAVIAAMAAHFREAISVGELEKAIAYSVQGENCANAVYGYEEAIEQWEAGIALIRYAGGHEPLLADLLHRTAAVLFLLGTYDRWVVNYEHQALDLYLKTGALENAANALYLGIALGWSNSSDEANFSPMGAPAHFREADKASRFSADRPRCRMAIRHHGSGAFHSVRGARGDQVFRTRARDGRSATLSGFPARTENSKPQADTRRTPTSASACAAAGRGAVSARISIALSSVCAGSSPSANFPANSSDLECHRLTFSCIGRCGIGVGSQWTLSCRSRPSTNQQIEAGLHSI